MLHTYMYLSKQQTDAEADPELFSRGFKISERRGRAGQVGCDWAGGRFNQITILTLYIWTGQKGSCQFLVKECAQYWLTA